MNMSLPLYEDLYVVSDIHMGGTQGNRIFCSGPELKELICDLADKEPFHHGKRALLLNGDIFDTLAENLHRYVSRPEEAETILHDIMEHGDFKMVWEALAGFVSRPAHYLVICIGNHDIELAYPNVQEKIANHLVEQACSHIEKRNEQADDKAEPCPMESIRGRILFSATGTGYLCRVGNEAKNARVLCLHGNEYDNWNAMSPESIERLVRSACLRVISPIADEPPNAGTQLVIDVMNKIKGDFPFVDLLKPEVETVFNVLAALHPSLLKEIPALIGLVTKAETEGKRRTKRVLGEADDDSEEAAPGAPEWQPSGPFGDFLEPSSDLLDKAWKLSASEDITPEEQSDEVLGLRELIDAWRINVRYWINRIENDKPEAMRKALLGWLGGDETWKIDGPDDVCDAISHFAPDVNVVIAGHTHLRRQKTVERDAKDDTPLSNRYLYINTGTWARLMRLDEKRLGSNDEFGKLWKTLNAHSMEALDGSNCTIRNPGTVGVVRLRGCGTAVEAALCKFDEANREFKPYKDADFHIELTWQEVTYHD